MSFRRHLQNAIIEEADKLIARHQRYARDVHDELSRIERRSGVVHPKHRAIACRDCELVQ